MLIVDDMEFNLLTLKMLLGKFKVNVDLAHDGEEAVQLVEEKY